MLMRISRSDVLINLFFVEIFNRASCGKKSFTKDVIAVEECFS